MSGARDVLEGLLPGVDEVVALRARRMTTFLRLLHTEARSRSASSVGVNLERARVELERDRRGAARAVVADLATQHLEAALSAATFVSLPRPRLSPRRAWARLEELRGDGLELPRVSAPDEPAVDVAGRMLAGLERLDEDGCSGRRLTALLERARGGPAAGERAFDGLFRSGATPLLRAAGLVGLIEVALDRGRVARAAELLATCPEGAPGAGAVKGSEDELALRLGLLGRWVALLSGREPDSLECSAGDPCPGPSTRLPTQLIELRKRRPEWSRYLRGRQRYGGRPPVLQQAPWNGARLEHGALVLAVFAAGPRGGVELIELEAQADLGPGIAAWSAGERPERATLAAGKPWLRHCKGVPLAGALSPRTASVAAWPVEASESARSPACEWVWLEFEHHLIPTTHQLQALARSWSSQRDRDPGSATAAGRDGSRPRVLVRERAGPTSEVPAAGALRETVEELVAGLAVKTRERRWWGLELAGDGLRVVAAGGGAPRGEACALVTAPQGAGQALQRVLHFRDVLRFEGAPELTLDPRSACGLVVPVVSRGSLLGALVFESRRKGDFGAPWVARVSARVRAGADRWRLARFRDWHRERRGRDVLFDLASAPGAELFEGILGAAGAAGPVVVSGAAGVGKTVSASWLHFEGAPAEAPFEVLTAAHGTTWAALRRALERAAGGTLCVEGLERLQERNRARLLASSARIVATCEGRSLRAVARTGMLSEATARVLERHEVLVPCLAERRVEVPDLARLLVNAAARELGLRSIALDERAAAWLWRQPWPENLRQLETLLHRCAQTLAAAAGDHAPRLEPDLLERIARRQGLEGLQSIPPRTATREIVRAALEVARTTSGALHRGRAALYLGWHPDTLARRARAHGLWSQSQGPG